MWLERSVWLSLVVACAACESHSRPLSCTYASDGELASHAQCAAHQRDASLNFAPAQLEQMSYSPKGLAEVLVEGRWHYVKRNGESLAVLTYDNGPDPFEQGLVRAQIEGRIAFYDETLRQVLPPKYDWAWPFHDGLARVCAGCKQGAPEGDGHVPVEGGLWGYIDRQGREVVAVKHPRAQLPEPGAQKAEQ